MHFAVYRFYFLYGDVTWQYAVEPVSQLTAVADNAFISIEMGYHHAGIDACVGATGSGYVYWLTE